MKRAITIPVLAVTAMLTACTIDGGSTETQVINHINVGDTVPSFTVSNTNGTFSSPDGFTGKTSVLILFNTECSDCKREMPKVYSLWKKINDNPAYQVVAIARDQTSEDVADNWIYGAMGYYPDPDRSIYNKFANMTIPRIYIIDAESKVVWMAIEELLNDSNVEMTAEQFEEKFFEFAT